MKIVKPLRLSVMSRPFPWQRRHCLSLTVIAMTGLGAAPHVLYPDVELWPLVAEEIGANGVLDLGMPKRSAEFLASGHAYTAHQATRHQCMARIQVGGLDKRLRVSGERYWLDGRATAPQPFERMPLDWRHAFGGPSFADNPLGIGADEEVVRGVRTRRLPNVESPDDPMHRPDHRPRPAGFGALDVMWPERFARIGQDYDERWARETFPAFSGDMDWHLFNAAPQDQWWRDADRIPDAAPYAIWNMHPELPCLQGRLPDWRARCFVTVGDTFTDAPMRLSTAWFFPHRERVVLIYHGLVDIREDDASDVLHLMPAIEEAGSPALPADHYRAILQHRLDADTGALHAFRDRDLLPASTIAPWLDTVSLRDRPLGPLARNAQRHAEEMRAQMQRRMIDDGQDPGRYRLPESDEEELPTLDRLPEFVASSRRRQAQAKQQLDAGQQQLAEAVRARAAEPVPGGPDLGPMQALAAGGPPAGLKGPPAAALASGLATMADSLREAATPGMAAVDELLAQRDTLDGALQRMYLLGAHHQQAADRMDAARAAQVRGEIAIGLQGARDFAGRDLTGADLSGMDLRGARFAGALLESADLRGARLDDADLSHAVLARAQFQQASLRGARLDGANLGHARCAQTDFTGASLRRTTLEQVHAEGCDFSETRWEDNTLIEARFVRCRFHRAHLRVVMLMDKVVLESLDFLGAHLFKVHFIGCRPGALRFAEATLESCVFVDVQASAPMDFSHARLHTTSVVGTSSLHAAVLRGAHLRECSLRRIALTQADLAGARLDNTDLSECDLSGADLSRANARDARFVRAVLQRASLRDAELIDADLQKADLRFADLRGANLFRADVSQSLMDGSTLLDGAYTRLAKTWPLRRDDAAA